VVVATSALVVAGALGGCTGQSSGGGQSGAQTTAAAKSAPTTMWRAEHAGCPTRPAHHAAAGAVLRYDGGCIRLVKRAATFHTAFDATLARAHGEWVVQVDLNKEQTAKFAKATKANVGHVLAIVADGTVLAAPQVEGPITSGRVQIVGTSKKQARHTAELLKAP